MQRDSIMLMRALIVALALLVGGCSASHDLVNCEGPPMALNPDDWHPSQAEMARVVHAIEVPR